MVFYLFYGWFSTVILVIRPLVECETNQIYFFYTFSLKGPFTYILFYKPYNVLTRFTKDRAEHVSLADFLKVEPDIYPVGRLDADSEGLLLLTNDKKLTSLIMEPAARKTKTYWVQVDGEIDAEAVRKLENGIDITVDHKVYRTKPCEVRIMPHEPVLPPRNPPVRFRISIPTSWVSITLREGKNRQIRKMCAAVGFPVLRLVRTKIGELSLGKLQPGKYITCKREMIYKALSLPLEEIPHPTSRVKNMQKTTEKKEKYKSYKKKKP